MTPNIYLWTRHTETNHICTLAAEETDGGEYAFVWHDQGGSELDPGTQVFITGVPDKELWSALRSTVEDHHPDGLSDDAVDRIAKDAWDYAMSAQKALQELLDEAEEATPGSSLTTPFFLFYDLGDESEGEEPTDDPLVGTEEEYQEFARMDELLGAEEGAEEGAEGDLPSPPPPPPADPVPPPTPEPPTSSGGEGTSSIHPFENYTLDEVMKKPKSNIVAYLTSTFDLHVRTVRSVPKKGLREVIQALRAGVPIQEVGRIIDEKIREKEASDTAPAPEPTPVPESNPEPPTPSPEPKLEPTPAQEEAVRPAHIPGYDKEVETDPLASTKPEPKAEQRKKTSKKPSPSPASSPNRLKSLLRRSRKGWVWLIDLKAISPDGLILPVNGRPLELDPEETEFITSIHGVSSTDELRVRLLEQEMFTSEEVDALVEGDGELPGVEELLREYGVIR